jgi:hypothetical protein
MNGQRFRLNRNTIAVFLDGDTKTVLLIPMNAEVVVTDKIPLDPTDGNRQVTVEWDGKNFAMFAVDIQARGERILSASV